MNSTNIRSFDQPLEFVNPLDIGGALFSINSLNFTLGKMKAGGIEFPMAFTQPISVTSCPRSPEVDAATFLVPGGTTTFFRILYRRQSGLVEIVNPFGGNCVLQLDYDRTSQRLFR